MSKISYCSLEEAWGDAYKDKDKDKEPNKEKERENVISNMNNIERNPKTNNNNDINSQYEKYRFNPTNNVIENDKQVYTPFNETIEKKYLQDKLNFLENEFRKYKIHFENEQTIEKFDNQSKTETHVSNNSTGSSGSNDMVDIILLIIIGLIIILVMNSIFSIGKSIGLRSKI